ncbi:MAG: MBOAT family protein [Lachnospiraceae bacterium]|nr:MBOAT family protein [Lachnospiraceae bacterium]
MTFTSSIFLIGLLPWFLLLAALTGKQNNVKIILLILMNSIFYLWGGIGAFFFVCGFAFFVGLFCKVIAKSGEKSLFALFLVLTILPLLFVKYSGFVIGNLNSLLGRQPVYHKMIIPLGISFFTFQAVSLLSDVYSGKITGKVSFLEVYTYLTFFPTVTSGPIMRFGNFKKGLMGGNCPVPYSASMEKIVLGLGKKVLIADKLAILANYYFDGITAGKSFSCAGLWIGSVAYTLQLYFDFSGYSDMAIGIGQLLGFEIGNNFNNPYQAKSISDFWKRWHISLSQWFRDYVYIPLGGNRCTVSRHILNLLVVWLLTGIWHGTGWSFIMWGMGYFLLLTMEKYLPFMKEIGSKWYSHIYALFFINLLWVPFRADSLTVAVKYLAGMFGIGSRGGVESRAVAFIPYLLVATGLCFPWKKVFEKYMQNRICSFFKGMVMIVIFVLAISAVISSSYTTYIYGNF